MRVRNAEIFLRGSISIFAQVYTLWGLYVCFFVANCNFYLETAKTCFDINLSLPHIIEIIATYFSLRFLLISFCSSCDFNLQSKFYARTNNAILYGGSAVTDRIVIDDTYK